MTLAPYLSKKPKADYSPIAIIDSYTGMKTCVRNFEMNNVCINNLLWLEKYNLILTKTMELINGNITDISYLTYMDFTNLFPDSPPCQIGWSSGVNVSGTQLS